MSNWLNIILTTVIALVPVVDPFSTTVTFLAITHEDTEEERARQARMGCVYMFLILTAFLFAGTLIMKFFGISMPGLRIAGGLMIARIAFDMLHPPDEKWTPKETIEAHAKKDISFTPLAMPSLSGPGAIAVTLGLTTQIEHNFDYLAIFIGIFIVSIFSWGVLHGAARIIRVLGTNGVHALTKIMGFLLLCVGIQFIINGVQELINPSIRF